MHSRGKHPDDGERELFPWPLRPPVRRVLWLILIVLAAVLWFVVLRGTGFEALR